MNTTQREVYRCGISLAVHKLDEHLGEKQACGGANDGFQLITIRKGGVFYRKGTKKTGPLALDRNDKKG